MALLEACQLPQKSTVQRRLLGFQGCLHTSIGIPACSSSHLSSLLTTRFHFLFSKFLICFLTHFFMLFPVFASISFFGTVSCQQPLFFPDSSVCMFGEAGWERKWETCVRFELGGKIMGRVGRTFQESVCMGVSPPLPFASPSPPNPCLICLFFQVQDSLLNPCDWPAWIAACCLWAPL